MKATSPRIAISKEAWKKSGTLEKKGKIYFLLCFLLRDFFFICKKKKEKNKWRQISWLWFNWATSFCERKGRSVGDQWVGPKARGGARWQRRNDSFSCWNDSVNGIYKVQRLKIFLANCFALIRIPTIIFPALRGPGEDLRPTFEAWCYYGLLKCLEWFVSGILGEPDGPTRGLPFAKIFQSSFDAFLTML